MARRFRLVAPLVPEVDLQAAVAEALDVLLLPRAMWISVPVGHVKLIDQQASRLG